MESNSRGRRSIFFLAVFLLAFAGRMIAVQVFQSEPVNDLLWNDAVAWNLAQGNGFTASQAEPRVPGIYRTPGYPAFLAAVYFCFDHSHYAAYVANALLDAASAVLIGLICLYYVPLPLACLTAALYAIYPYPAMFCPVLHQDILLTFCVMCILLSLARATKHPSVWRWLCTGILVGITTLVKPNFILFVAVPALTLLIAIGGYRRRSIYLALLALGTSIIVGPWMYRNYVVFGSFPLLAVGGTGTNLKYLAIEVNEGESALLKVIVGESGSAVGQKPEGFMDGADLIAHEKRLALESLDELKQAWPQYLWVSLKHIPRLWFSRYTVWHAGYIRLLAQAISLLVLIPGVVGMILLRKYWKTLFPLYMTVLLITFSYALYTVEARFTMPARPVMLLFVSATLMVLLGKKEVLTLSTEPTT